MKKINITTEYIKLDQFLKLADIIGTGGEAKAFILHNEICVNGEREERRGRKLHAGDTVSVNGLTYMVTGAGENK